MASISFSIKGKTNPKRVYARLKFEKLDVQRKTNFRVHQNDWSKSKNRMISRNDNRVLAAQINNSLSGLENSFNKKTNIALSEKTPITKTFLKDIVDNYFDQPTLKDKNDSTTFFTSFFEEFIDWKKDHINSNGKKVSHRTIQDYQTTLNKLKDFEKLIDKRLLHTDINLDFRDKFIKYCKDHHANSINTIGGQLSNIKTVCSRAEKKNIRISGDHKTSDFGLSKKTSEDFALKYEEIELIEKVCLKDNDRLDNARDWLIVGLWTGLRVSDILRLTSKNIDGDFIRIINKKTEIPVVIPIHDSIKKVLNKRNGNFPRRISSQKFNMYIKEVCEKAGLDRIVNGKKAKVVKVKGYIDGKNKKTIKEQGSYPIYEIISSHVCRRTFATYHYGKLDTLTIMNVTGHKTESQFLEYVKITPREHAKKMKEMWNIMRKSKSLI